MTRLNTDEMSRRFREAGADIPNSRLLITAFPGTDQEADLTEPPNCGGLGRIRHFKRVRSANWPENPLPIDPAAAFLGVSAGAELRAQVFQNAVCNWRCWYCFVPFDLLRANREHSAMVSCGDLLDAYQAEENPPPVIDLTGGQPDLIPEWVPWMMAELRQRELEGRVFLWSDDNLSNDYLWRFLSEDQRRLMASFSGYGRVACFKGYDASSFSFNTLAEPELFDQQFDLARRLLTLGVDTYFYATFTSADISSLDSDMPRFVERLQAVHPNLPLRLVPLEIQLFTPVHARVRELQRRALDNQYRVVESWSTELDRLFPASERSLSISRVSLR